ncbi:hypothetical protein [Herbaspirillum sp. NPDC101396]|uniref:hypothetical protein n=1 Tax=Herbaspirillum sp. NPDC101396 TaxID=3364005 RepID=UPI00383B9F74
MDDELMSIDDIAELHKCSRQHARDTIVKIPGFPAEAPTSRPRHKLWVREEVIAFVTRRPSTIE